jgi:hypothetical protein
VDKGESLRNRINIDHDTYMAYATARTGTGEEYQVATLQFIAGDGDIASILVSGRGPDKYICLLLENIAGETGTVECVRTLGA